MAQMLMSLDSLSGGYTVFEKDQLLTHDQLNRLTAYFDDQDRLSRVALLGVGIVCGLRPRLDGQSVHVGRGVGVTTDGDLLFVPADVRFSRFAIYTPPMPEAPPRIGGMPISAFELRPDDDGDTAPLADFATATGGALGDMVAVLVAQTYVADRDLCSGTDCDNLGQDAVHAAKVLLVDRATASMLRPAIASPREAARALDEVASRRPPIGRGLTQVGGLTARYREACEAMHAGLTAALAKLYPTCGAFLAGALPGGDPTAAWLGRLTELRKRFIVNGTAIQYYYDFLKDLVDAYGELSGALAADRTTCCPAADAFAKHLLLGSLAADHDGDDDRTQYYPSPAVGGGVGCRATALLVRRLDAMIRSFTPPAPGALPIRVTPSGFEDRPIGERAIPYYYRPDHDPPLSRCWSQAHSDRGRETSLFSYHAAAYGAQGAAADPLAGPVARFAHFRIEGHLGQNAARVVEQLEAEIAARNLPFTVRAVHLGSERAHVTIRPPLRFSDLHRWHDLLRRDVAEQMQDAVDFSNQVVTDIQAAVGAGTLTGGGDGVNDPIQIARTAQQAIHAQVKELRLTGPYREYRPAGGWQARVSAAVGAAVQFKHDLGDTARTEHDNPFDGLIANRQTLWIGRLDDLIRQREESRDDRLLFDRFVGDHPGLEHLAGVLRGGTFVLVYDSSDMVVADFALPYRWEDDGEPEPPVQPDTTTPPPRPRPPGLLPGLRWREPLERMLTKKLTNFRVEVQTQWQTDLTRSSEDFKRISIAATGRPLDVAVRPGSSTLLSIQNPQLLDLVSKMEGQAQKAEILSQRLEQTAVASEQAVIKAELAATELQLAESVAATMTQVVAPANEGTPDAMAAAAAAALAAGKIKNNVAAQHVDTQLAALQPAAKPTMHHFMEGMKVKEVKPQLKKKAPRKRSR